MRAHYLICLVAFTLAFTSGARTSAADGDGDGSFKVIVNPQQSIDRVDRDFLREMYLKKRLKWPSGDVARPVDLPSKMPARDRFTEQVLRKTPAQLRTYWNQQIFSGKGVPPPEVDSVEELIAYVLAHKGAVGYIPADADPGKARVIGIK